MSAAPRTTLPPAWQPGQIFQAVVMKSQTPEQLFLNIQGTDIRVQNPPANTSFNPGDKVQLQLLQLGIPPQFRLLPRQIENMAAMTQQLRAQLPKQQPLPPLLANLELIQRDPKTAMLLEPKIRQLTQQLFNQLPTAVNLRQPAEMKQALNNTGPFLENNLLRLGTDKSIPIQQDLRSQLLRLATALRAQHPIPTPQQQPASAALASAPASTPGTLTASLSNRAQPAYTGTSTNPASKNGEHTTQAQLNSRNPKAQAQVASSIANQPATRAAEELMRQSEGALARMLMQQFQHLKSEEQGQSRLWSMELPVRSENGINLFDIRIQREPHWPYTDPDEQANQSSQQVAHTWSVRIAFELEGMGPVYATVSLRNKHISVQFHAEQTQTSALFNQYMDMLGSRLRLAGLDINELECTLGQPEPVTEPIMNPIVDEQA
ncbi:MAG: flagellar hook-length control protein FliK [Gammaproteobacteria bacterium]|nr:flagellar hook-length control protein FliK [Gammaproteobacteria bacterium]